MPVPFGFSFGDFVSAVSLFKDIVVALKDHGGASDNFQQTTKELDTIVTILDELQHLPASNQNSA